MVFKYKPFFFFYIKIQIFKYTKFSIIVLTYCTVSFSGFIFDVVTFKNHSETQRLDFASKDSFRSSLAKNENQAEAKDMK